MASDMGTTKKGDSSREDEDQAIESSGDSHGSIMLSQSRNRFISDGPEVRTLVQWCHISDIDVHLCNRA